jgi:hypothetical protein
LNFNADEMGTFSMLDRESPIMTAPFFKMKSGQLALAATPATSGIGGKAEVRDLRLKRRS